MCTIRHPSATFTLKSESSRQESVGYRIFFKLPCSKTGYESEERFQLRGGSM